MTLGLGVSGPGLLRASQMGASVGPVPFDFQMPPISAFTAAVDKRLCAGKGPFFTGPYIEGKLDGTGVPDVVTYPRGDLLANQTQFWYANFDPYQFTAIKWWTAETASADRAAGYSYVWYVSADYYARYDYANSRFEFRAGGVTHTQASAILAGTTYFVVFSADTKHSIDGTNLCRSSIDNVHNYGGSGLTASAPDATIAIGSDGSASPASAIIEGLTWLRRILTDGDGFGTNIGVLDEIEDIYAAGAGADPTLITGGAFDVVACMPTNSTDEELVTGPGEMWSMPHADSIPDVTFMEDGGLPGTPFAAEFNGTTQLINCGSGVTLDDLPDAAMTAHCYFRWDGSGIAKQLLWKRQDGDGWYLQLQADGDIGAVVVCATTNAVTLSVGKNYADGKLHLATMTFDDAGARDIALWIDGVDVSDVVTTGVGAYQSDVANDFVIGSRDPAQEVINGAIVWVALYDALEYVAGTDFIAPRTAPAPGGNLVESWHLDEGSGLLAAAQVTVPGNNGTLAVDAWSSIWEQELTPVVPRSILYDGAATSTVVADAAAIQDLHAGEFTAEAWISPDSYGVGGRICDKTGSAAAGWLFFLSATAGLAAIVYCATANAISYSSTARFPADGIAHLVTIQFDGTALPAGNPLIYFWIDGVPLAAYDTQDAGVGNIVSDVGDDLYLGNRSAGDRTFDGRLGGWARLSDTLRYTPGEAFVPDAFSNPPALPDANSVWQTDYSDGAGTTLTDDAAGGNDGTITFGAGRWLVTPDMALQEPGARAFNNGYVIGSDGANDGITDIETVVAETDYVIRPFVSPGQSGRAWPEIYLYDNNGAAQIGATYSLPRMTDIHTGGNNLATLINANGSFTQQLVGWALYNITDGSSTTITAVSGDKTTITGVLAGGTDDDWDTNDVYIIRPPGNAPYCRYPIATEAIFVFRTPVACVSMDIKIRNAAGEGVMQVHQCEVYENLLNSGDMEGVFAGVPPIPPNWINFALDAGDTQAEAVIIHSGAQSIRFNAGAISNERIYQAPVIPQTRFYSVGAWEYSTGGDVTLDAFGPAQAHVQADPTDDVIAMANASYWAHAGGVMRQVSATVRYGVQPRTGAGGLRYVDDAFAFLLDAITITVVPANQANSLEGTGIRVDGRDTLTQPIPVGYLSATSGWIRWLCTPRHDAADAVAFGVNGNLPQIMQARFDGTRQINVFWLVANTVRLGFNDGGGGHNVDWNATGLIVTGATYLMEVRYAGSWMRLYVDGVQVSEIVTPINFTAIPNIAYWLGEVGGTRQVDAVIGPP